MCVGTKKFAAKTIERIAGNFLRWRDRTVQDVNTIGTHWPVRCGGKLCGELTYDGRFWPADTRGRRPCDIVADMLAERFGATIAHSAEYRAGVRAALEWRLMRSPMGCPYAVGSVQADAFSAGVEEGRRISAGLGEPKEATAVARGGPMRRDIKCLS